jgi:hypothetical protein
MPQIPAVPYIPGLPSAPLSFRFQKETFRPLMMGPIQVTMTMRGPNFAADPEKSMPLFSSAYVSFGLPVQSSPGRPGWNGRSQSVSVLK